MQKWFILIFSIFIFSIGEGFSQSLAKPAEGFKNSFGSAVSTGVFLNKDAVFWGLGVDYSRVFKEKWIIDISMAYDQEHSNTDNDGKLVVNTFTPSIAVGYVITPKFVMGVGIGKGIFDDDNENKEMKFNKNGGWTLGLLGVLTLYQKGRHGFDISGGIEQGLTNPETDITVELGYGYSF